MNHIQKQAEIRSSLGKLSFDGYGINAPDACMTRICSFRSGYEHYGNLMAHSKDLLEALRELADRSEAFGVDASKARELISILDGGVCKIGKVAA